MAYVLINGKKLPTARARVPVQDRGFRYGDGVFETIAAHNGTLWRFGWHLERLTRGLKAVRIAFSTKNLDKECRALIKKNKVKDGILRIQVTRGAGGRGYLPDANVKPTCVIETLPMPKVPTQPITLWLSSYRRIATEALPVRYKLCQGLNSTLARMEAADHNYFEALMLNSDKEICETGSGNIFWLKNNTLYTPSLECGAVEGATRAALIELSPYPVKQVRAGLKTLAAAEAVFIANVAWKILPVAALKPAGLRWDSAVAAQFFRALLIKDIKKRCG